MRRTGTALLIALTVGATAGTAAWATGPARAPAPDVATYAGGAARGHTGGAATSAVAGSGLSAFADCEQLRRWYVRVTLPRVGPWGLDGYPVSARDGRSPLPPGRLGSATTSPSNPERGVGPDAAVGSSPTGSNVQEPDVDEADTAKTDGRIVVRVVGRDLVVTDVAGARPVQLSRTRLPGARMVSPELVLSDGRVLVVGDEPVLAFRSGPIVDLPSPRSERGTAGPGHRLSALLPGPVAGPRTQLVSYDLSDPAAPRLTAADTLDGGVLATRSYRDGTVRVAIRSGTPDLPFVRPSPTLSQQQALVANRAVVRSAPAEAWLPQLRSRTGATRPVLGCTDVRHPVRPSGSGTVSVLTYRAATAVVPRATAVATAGDLVYSSADRLYVATAGDRRTAVHAFALTPGRTEYTGSGTVPGTVEDRWSMSEQGGLLRVATALGDPWSPRENAVTVLAQDSYGRLLTRGRVAGIGPGEQVKAVRWLGDLAVLVTFRQTDPVHTVDLTDPARPRVLDELEVPGFSVYLHPVGDGLLVGLGRAATSDGRDVGAQVSTFDVHDPTAIRRTGLLGLGTAAILGVETDPRAFTYLPRARTLLTSVEDRGSYASGVLAVHVGADGTLARAGSWPTSVALGAGVRMLPLAGDRVALVDDAVRVVQVG